MKIMFEICNTSGHSAHKWRTNLLLVLIVLLSGYMLLSNHDHNDWNDIIDIVELEKEIESSRPVRHVSYKSPLDENLFKPWTDHPHHVHHQQQHLQAGGSQDAGQWGNEGLDRGNEESSIISGGVGQAEGAASRVNRYRQIWSKAKQMMSETQLYPAYDEAVGEVLNGLATAKLLRVDVLDIGDYESGTAEKWLATLEGGQKAVIKIIWEEKGTMKRGALCNYGFEMPSAEIAAFHLHRVLGYNNTPYVTGRKLNLLTEVLPVATAAVSKQIITRRGNVTCIKGTCTHCKVYHTQCPRDGLIEVSVAYWMPYKLKIHTFPIKYMPYSTPRMDEWGSVGFNNKTYCRRVKQNIEPYTTNNRLYLDLFDFSALDTIMYHYDSKHYTVDNPSHPVHGLTVRLDHGRAFCAHDRDEDSVFLAPIRQCCLMRRSSYERLRRLRGANKLRRRLEELLQNDPISQILEPAWYPALERRLESVLQMIDKCIASNGRNNVLIDEHQLNLYT